MIPEVRADKERELQGLQQSIQKFQQDAQVSLQRKSSELVSPVFKTIQDAIDKVAKDNGYTHIFNSGQPDVGLNILLYARDEDDISNLVLKELGITPPAPTAEEPASGN
jgi:outer membrane protein